MVEDFIHRYCQECEDFLPSTEECRLLREHDLNEVFEHGRCQPYENLLKPAVKGNLQNYDHLLKPEEYLDSETFLLAERLKKQRLQSRFTIYALKGYINTAARNTVLKLVSRLLPPSSSQPIAPVQPTGAFSTPLPGFFEQILKLLRERAENEQGTKRKQIYERHYIILVNMRNYLQEGMDRSEAIKMIASEIGERPVTVYRDIFAIQEYLAQKNVINFSKRGL